MIRITQTGSGGQFDRLSKGLQPANLDKLVDKVAFQVLAELVKASPKKWFGQIRSGWRITTPQIGQRKLDIDPAKKTIVGTSVADIAKFVDQGTANQGSDRIYPKRSKFLYIPLKRTAVIWRPGLKFGKDYVLSLSVRGIKPRRFVSPVRLRARQLLNEALMALVEKLKNGGSKNG